MPRNPFLSNSEKFITPFAYDYHNGKLEFEQGRHVLNWNNQVKKSSSLKPEEMDHFKFYDVSLK